MCSWFLGIIILLLSCCIENVGAAVNKEDFFFTRLEFEDGLSQQTVFTIFQDSDHFIWKIIISRKFCRILLEIYG